MLALILVGGRLAAREIPSQSGDSGEPITIAADTALRWTEGPVDVWMLRGNCYLNQGLTYARSQQAIVWIQRPARGERAARVTVYLEGGVSVDGGRASDAKRAKQDQSWLGRFTSLRRPQMQVARVSAAGDRKPAIYRRATARRDPQPNHLIRRTQFTTSQEAAPATGQTPPGVRRISIYPRSSRLPQAKWFPSGRGDEWIVVVNSGVNLIVDGMADVGAIDISTDRLVIWTTGLEKAGAGGPMLQSDDTPLEVYLEGNIVFRQGNRVIHADRMFYNLTTKTGIAYGAQIFTPLESFAGTVRLKAGMIEQLDKSTFIAHDAAITTSRLGVPSYWFQSKTLTFRDFQQPLFDGVTGGPMLDPQTQEPVIQHRQQVGAAGNTVYLEGLPIFYWPAMQTDLRQPTYYLSGLKAKSDSVFGNQIFTDWNAYQVLGIAEPPEGTEWEFSLDYFDERGFAAGTNFNYDRDGLLGLPGPYTGALDVWGIRDNGLDNLGRDRRALVPEMSDRGRALWQHRHQLSGNLTLSAELGWVSDRNFLEQYLERDWDQNKDKTTGVELKGLLDNSSWSLRANGQINDFFTQTQWLPRADHYWLGESLLGDRLTWYEHTSAGYANMKLATAPTNPIDAAKFDPLAWEGNFDGERIVTRQEIDLPMSVGWLKVVPYALGELGHWGSDLSSNDIQRAYGQLGVRASVPIWSVNPRVESELLNVHGVAHKVVFDADFSYADANRDLSQFPLYDQLDDDAVEHFRRRFFFDSFGGVPGGNVAQRFDERYYALRTGMAGQVTAASTEIADDLTTFRFGAYQRWQTKRGPVGARHTVDWITLDTRAVLFPEADRDNYGQELGLAEYDFSWHVGDRVSLLSDGIFDMFSGGQRFIRIGGVLNQPPQGSLYLGLRSLEGPISANVVTATYSYKMSPKWITTFGSSFDLGSDGNIGQFFSITRLGESMLVRAGFNVDASRGSVGFKLVIEPRFLPKSRLSRFEGAQALPAGTFNPE